MSETPFATALRAEIEAIVTRYEALVRTREETLSALREQSAEALRAAIAQAHAERDTARAERDGAFADRDAARASEAALRSDLASQKARIASLEAALGEAKAQVARVEAEARSAGEAAKALGDQFSAEQAFVQACQGLDGSMLAEALKGAAGRELDASPATYAALKSRGLEVVLTQTFRDRGRSAAQAPLLDRESRALPGIAAAAGCELITPAAGQRFVSTSMDKATTVAEPAEEGNVVGCLMPGARRIGTEGALVLPRVVVATG